MPSTYLDQLEQTCLMLGFPPVRRQVPGPYECPVHGGRLSGDQLGAFNGWHQVLLCAQFDRTCSYGPDRPADRISKPTDILPDGTPDTEKVVEARDLGGGLSVVILSGPSSPPPARDPLEAVVDNGDGTSTWTFRVYADDPGDENVFGFEPVAVDEGALDPATVKVFTLEDRMYASVQVRPSPGEGTTVCVAPLRDDVDISDLSGMTQARDQFGRAMHIDVSIDDDPTNLMRVHVVPTGVQTLTVALQAGLTDFPIDGLRVVDEGQGPARITTYVKDGVAYADVPVESTGWGCDTALTIALLAPGADAGWLAEVDDERLLKLDPVTLGGVIHTVLAQFDED